MSDYSNIEGADRSYPRGETRVGHTGWVAWIDDGTRDVHCKKGRCIATGPVQIRTDDGEHTLTVPHGRLQWSQAAAFDALTCDVREEGERQMRMNDQDIERIYQEAERRASALRLYNAETARGMLLHLLAIELAKAGSKDPESMKAIGESLKRLGQTPVDDPPAAS